MVCTTTALIADADWSGMSDLIDRKVAFEVLTDYYHHKTEVQHEALKEALSRVPSAEPERMAKVIYRNTTMGLSFCCGNCCKPVHSEGKYCHHCGVRLEWE